MRYRYFKDAAGSHARSAIAAALLGAALLAGPQLAAAQSANNCMGDEGFGINPSTGMTFVQGMQNSADLNCTANDVVIADTTLVSVNGEPVTGPVECIEGEVLTVELLADLESNSNARRSDIGIWLAEDGGSAITGACQHFYFEAPELQELDVIPDGCRDIGAQQLFEDVPLDTPEMTLNLVCRDDDGNGRLDVGSCIGWKIPGDDQICPNDADGDGTANEPNDFIKGTLPANKAKCRCGNVEVPITVNKVAHIEVVKDLHPDNDTGLFTLLIDGDPTATSENVGDGGSTERTEVSAGTSQNPGATHTVGEIAGSGTDLSLYTSSIECVDRGKTTFNGGPPLTQDGTGPLDVMVDPDDDVLCTVTNIRPSVTLDKTGDALSKIGDDIDYTVTVENTSPAGAFALECTITDALLGIDETVTLASGQDHVIDETYTVGDNDDDPLDNEAFVSCTFVGGATVVASADDDHSVNLFQPSISFDKKANGSDGPLILLEGATVEYTLTLQNTSSGDTPDLVCTISDPDLGIDENVTLASDADPYVITESRTFPTATVFTNTASVSCSPEAFPNQLPASDSVTVEVIAVSALAAVEKFGDLLSKTGDAVDYTINVSNIGDAGDPSFVVEDVTDDVLGNLVPGPNPLITASSCGDGTLELQPGQSCTIEATRTVQQSDPDPLVNVVDVTLDIGGNEVVLDDMHSVNLFQPSFTFTKAVDSDFSKVGDTVGYTLTVDNTSSADTPDLACTVTDSALGIDESFSLSSGDPDKIIELDYTVRADDDSGLPGATLSNTAATVCSPDGFPNALEQNDSASVTLVHPSFTVTKTCSNEPVPQQGPATWDVEIANTGDVALVITADDGIGTFPLAAGASEPFEVSQSGPFTGQQTVGNTVDVSAVIDPSVGTFTNVIAPAEASDDCIVSGRVTLAKTGPDATDVFTFALYDGPDGFGSSALATDATPPSPLDFGDIDLDPSATYTLCELGLPAGWTSDWSVGGNPVAPYNPDLPGDDGNRCVDFGAGTGIDIPPGGAVAFAVTNIPPPGGDARTPGYWKNWNRCSKGRQAETAESNGGAAEGFWLLEDFLPEQIGDLSVESCQDAVNLLNKSDLGGGKRANDAAYNLTTALLAYELNVDAGVGSCTEATDAAAAAQTLLSDIGFDGTGSYLTPRGNRTLRREALRLAGTLDAFNNNQLCQ